MNGQYYELFRHYLERTSYTRLCREVALLAHPSALKATVSPSP